MKIQHIRSTQDQLLFFHGAVALSLCELYSRLLFYILVLQQCLHYMKTLEILWSFLFLISRRNGSESSIVCTQSHIKGVSRNYWNAPPCFTITIMRCSKIILFRRKFFLSLLCKDTILYSSNTIEGN
jgi:hypothetical protein